MKIFKMTLLSISLLVSVQAYGGGAGGNGGPPAKESELLEGGLLNGSAPLTRAEELLGRIPADDLLQGLDGSIRIPLSEDNIRRLKVRTSVTGTTPLTLDNGERFVLERDLLKDKLVDFKKAAEVIQRTTIQK